MPEDTTDEEWTCGKGLAANAVLPSKLAVLSDAMAALLEAHTHALVDNESATIAERDVYQGLTERYRSVAGTLKATADEMADYGDLPAAAHDMQVMSDGRQRAAFERLVHAKQHLLAMLQDALPEDQRMVDEMRADENTKS